eukprot:4653798-Lingulodinium_polyedra.AAC.1
MRSFVATGCPLPRRRLAPRLPSCRSCQVWPAALRKRTSAAANQLPRLWLSWPAPALHACGMWP